MESVWFCEKCDKLIPEKDTKILSGDKRIHYITKPILDPILNKPLFRRTGFDPRAPTTIKHFCGGPIREPTPEEYFILYTCNSNRNI